MGIYPQFMKCGKRVGWFLVETEVHGVTKPAGKARFWKECEVPIVTSGRQPCSGRLWVGNCLVHFSDADSIKVCVKVWRSMSRQGHPIFDERMKQRWLSWDRAKLPRLLDANADQYLYGWTKFRSWSRPALASLGGPPPWHNDISCDISSPSFGWKCEYEGMVSIFLLMHQTASSSGYTALHLKVCTISEAHSHSTAPRATLLIWQARSCQVLQVAQDNIFKISTYHLSKS